SACSFEQPRSSWAANSRLSYEGLAYIIDLGKSRAEAEGEAQLVEQDFDPAVAPHTNCAAGSHVRPRSPLPSNSSAGGTEAVHASDWIPAVPPSLGHPGAH